MEQKNSKINYFINIILYYIITLPGISRAEIIDVSGRKQLFIDNKFINSSDNITLTVNPPKKIGTAISRTLPWEMCMFDYNTVIEDQGYFKIWYGAYDWTVTGGIGERQIGYATSHDGIHWSKPVIGLVDYKGSLQNNILPVYTLVGWSTFLDPKSNSRFKILTLGSDRFIYIYESNDGIHFQKNPNILLDLTPDTQNQILYDVNINKYVAYLRSWNFLPEIDGGLESWRTVSRLELDDPSVQWPYNHIQNPYYKWGTINPPAISTEMNIVMACDKNDLANTDLYTPCVVQYPYAEGIYLAFPSPYLHFQNPDNGKGLLNNIELAVSRDGKKWNRYRTPYVNYDILDSYITQMYMGIGMAKIKNNFYQYITALETIHSDNPKLTDRSDIYIVQQRIDGFVSADAFDLAGC